MDHLFLQISRTLSRAQAEFILDAIRKKETFYPSWPLLGNGMDCEITWVPTQRLADFIQKDLKTRDKEGVPSPIDVRDVDSEREARELHLAILGFFREYYTLDTFLTHLRSNTTSKVIIPVQSSTTTKYAGQGHSTTKVDWVFFRVDAEVLHDMIVSILVMKNRGE